jgi:hypothetical protein
MHGLHIAILRGKKWVSSAWKDLETDGSLFIGIATQISNWKAAPHITEQHLFESAHERKIEQDKVLNNVWKSNQTSTMRKIIAFKVF